MDDLGVYVTYKDKDGNEQKEYFPQFTADDENNVTTITVGGTTYKIPKACKCSITKNADGTYTISDGKGNEFKSYTCPDWVNTTQVTYNTTTGQFEISSGTQKVAIPNGYAELSVDATTGVATVTGSDGTTKIKLQETQPVVYTDGKGHVAIQNYDLKTGEAVGDAYTLPTYGEFAALTKKVDDIDTDLTNVKNQIGTWDPTTQGKTITEAIEGITSDINTLESNISSMFETLMKKIAESITNIQVEEVMSNAIGSFNGVLTNLKSTKLVGYYGTTDAIDFPSFEEDANQFHKEADVPAMSNILGDIQLTVNPIGTDFSNLSVSLVNSLGEESSIKLSNLVASDKLLKTGITRATGTGLYTTKATVSAENVNDSRLHMAVDKSVVKEAVKAAWNDLKKAYSNRSLSEIQGGTLNKVVNAIYNVVNGVSTERLAVKTEWEQKATDPVSGNEFKTKKSIVSPFDLSGVMVKPLGFESLPEQYRDSIRAIKKAKGFIKKLNDKIADRVKETINKRFGLDKIESQIGDLQGKLAKIEPIDPSLTTNITMHLYIKTNQDLKFDQDMTVGYEILVPTSLYETPGWEADIQSQGARIRKDKSKTMTSDPTFTMVYIEQDVTFHVEKTIPITIDQDVTANNVTIDVSDLVEPVNNAVDAIKSINALCESVNDIIDEIRNLEAKIEKGEYLNRVYKLIDKVSAYSAKGIYKMFQPVLLVNSGAGFGFAGIRGVPAEVSGTVEVIPTTYSNGLVAPVYKKYIRVNGKNGKVLEEGQVALDITSELNKGSNTVEYYAIDYYGNEWHGVYEIRK